MHPGGELAGGDRRGHGSIGAGVEGVDAFVDLFGCGEHKDGDLAVCAQLAAHIDTLTVGVGRWAP